MALPYAIRGRSAKVDSAIADLANASSSEIAIEGYAQSMCGLRARLQIQSQLN